MLTYRVRERNANATREIRTRTTKHKTKQIKTKEFRDEAAYESLKKKDTYYALAESSRYMTAAWTKEREDKDERIRKE